MLTKNAIANVTALLPVRKDGKKKHAMRVAMKDNCLDELLSFIVAFHRNKHVL